MIVQAGVNQADERDVVVGWRIADGGSTTERVLTQQTIPGQAQTAEVLHALKKDDVGLDGLDDLRSSLHVENVG